MCVCTWKIALVDLLLQGQFEGIEFLCAHAHLFRCCHFHGTCVCGEEGEEEEGEEGEAVSVCVCVRVCVCVCVCLWKRMSDWVCV